MSGSSGPTNVIDDVATALNNAASYTVAQCTYFVAQLLSWVPPGLGNAKDWLANARARGLATSSAPAPGDVVVYGAGGGYSQFGHVAYVTGVNPDQTFNVVEENFVAPGKLDTRTSSLADVEGFILPPAGAGSGAPGQLVNLVPGLADLLKLPNAGGPPGLPSLPNPVGDLAGAISGIPTAVGHGLADAIGVGVHDVETFAQRQVIALAVAGVVLLVLFER